MRACGWILLVSAAPWVAWTMGSAGKSSTGNAQHLSSERKVAIEDEVRHFASKVAQDVTQNGPTAWRKEFSDSPSFFMASNGQLAFANPQAAAKGIDELTRMIKQIELRWGDDLRVDVLTEDLAMVAASWHEFRVDAQGHRVEDGGFFTGLIEKQKGQWRFRNAHWSEPLPPPKVP